jgi:hypothetical protein
MLTMYLDESYSHAPKPLIYTVAGYLSEDSRWREFEKHWGAALSDEGLEYFHMSEFAQGIHNYQDWPEDRRRRLLRKLHGIIHENTLADFSISVVVAAFDEIITPDIREGFGGKPHVFAAIGCLKSIAAWVDDNALAKEEKIFYIFEQGATDGTALPQVFERYFNDDRQREMYRLEGFAFRDKKEMPLQAADVLAYENMLEMRRLADPENTRKPRASMLNLERPESDWGYFGTLELLDLVVHPTVMKKMYARDDR